MKAQPSGPGTHNSRAGVGTQQEACWVLALAASHKVTTQGGTMWVQARGQINWAAELGDQQEVHWVLALAFFHMVTAQGDAMLAQAGGPGTCWLSRRGGSPAGSPPGQWAANYEVQAAPSGVRGWASCPPPTSSSGNAVRLYFPKSKPQ